MKKKKVLYVFNGDKNKGIGASAIYRATIPATIINQQKNSGYQVDWLWLDDFGTLTLDDVREYSIIIFPRFYVARRDAARLETARLFRLLRENNIRILVEFDDDYSNEHRQVVDGDFAEAASWTDGCIVTTPFLAERIETLTGLRTYVCPNSLIPDLSDPKLTGIEKEKGKLRILLSGTATHNEDWRVLGEVLPGFMQKYQHKVRLMIGGFHPDYLKNLPSTLYYPVLPYMMQSNVRNEFEYVGLVQTADIVLCPVMPDDLFNRGKSEIKAVEGMAGGAFVIATDNPVYRLAISHLRNGYLTAHTAVGWWGALEFAVTRKTDRIRIAKRGYRSAWRDYNAAKNWNLWVRTFNNVIRRNPNSVILPIDEGYPITPREVIEV